MFSAFAVDKVIKLAKGASLQREVPSKVTDAVPAENISITDLVEAKRDVRFLKVTSDLAASSSSDKKARGTLKVNEQDSQLSPCSDCIRSSI